ncbi:TIR domain-containing protein [Leptolyngbyaceae cyanobacterium CCMR0082]|uniref:TIR domain-containing protein n=1 Tax=Adonisia turfae CCMR0082 TaxID=2304604 RepID=A0A6M0SD15_9CYAN|nr:TIR domain-containing protein [Adonisia turfae]NEZ66370.1 TIR domain-containing protein [Adonisia turfae CCMR0082]
MADFKDVFISYGRPDSKGFAIKLKARLVEEGFNVWLDLNDIPLGVDFQKYIDQSLHKAHNVIFIISPHAVNSKYCGLELERALQFKKRILPLLHIDEISRETWQQRNPQGTEQDWLQYQAEGRHSCYPNMHPAIKKLNWAFFQDDKNDFELALQDLVALLKTEIDYVQQHTQLLNQALTWLEHQNQTRYLLTGKTCQTATEWLTRNNELVSCEPSELHCEFITQSIKNTQNLMCQVFLSYAEEDGENAIKIRRSLTQRAFTVWTSRTDIVTGEDFLSAIHRGIEQADNLIYMISPEAMVSKYCQDELNYALSLHKRIIPILACPTDIAQIPEVIRAIQYIDLTDNVREEDYLLDESQLLQVLKHEATYHEEHKTLLVKALKWQRQEDNPSILLKGHSISHYVTWLKLANQRPLYGPTELQRDFVGASAQQSPDMTLDVFIASAAADLDFARKLNETLQVQGQSTWFEQESVVPESDFAEELKAGITASENIVYILSPDAVASAKCKSMIDYALAFNKRLLVILYGETQDTKLPASLKEFPRFDFRQQDGDFLSNFGRLYRALESNPQHTREHTRLLIKATEWEQENQDDDFLLRGRRLTAAEAWLSQAHQNMPQPTELQCRYIKASRELPLRRIRPISVALWSIATGLLVAFARMVGLFQPIDLAVYDHLLRQRPDEHLDDRFTLIEVDTSSGKYLRDKLVNKDYQPGIGTIPDQALLDVLDKLEVYSPRLIGLDFYRDFQTDLPRLAQKLRNTENLIGICKAQAGEADALAAAGQPDDPNLQGFHPIYEVLPQDYPNRIGFNDLLDDGDLRVRRHYLWKTEDAEFCDVQQAFSLTLVRRYLEGEGVAFTAPASYGQHGSIFLQPHSMRVGNVGVPQLRPGGRAAGLYFDSTNLKGYQTLLNFRTVDGHPEKFAVSIPLQDVLEGDLEPDLIRDRIVLIGITDLSENADVWNTAYQDMPGVIIHGQMASQLISAALDDRPLIWWLPLDREVLWIVAWSALGGLIAWGFYRPLPLVLAMGGGVLVIYVLSWGVMITFAGFLPMVPAISALLGTGSIILYCNYRLRKV